MKSNPARHDIRLAAFLLASLVFHVTVLILARPISRTILPERANMPLEVVSLGPPRADPPPPAPVPFAAREVRPSLATSGQSAIPTEVEEQAPSQSAQKDATPPPASVPVPAHRQSARLDTATLLTNAHAMARERLARDLRLPSDNPMPEERPFLPGLDRALKREPPGERYLGNGLTRVVTPSGRDYCLQAPPDFARGGPAVLLSVPTNCP